MSDMRNCPFCDEEIRKKAKLCRFCKKAVEPIYVENKKVNSQIVNILDSIEAGEDYISVASKLNESGDYRVDTGEVWDAGKVEEIHISFTKYLTNERKGMKRQLPEPAARLKKDYLIQIKLGM